jgi:ABC-2 type transport system permease protein
MSYNFFLFREFFRISTKEAVSHRSDFFLGFFHSLLSIVTSIIVLYFMFQRTNRLGGWDLAGVIVIIGFFRLLKALMDTFFSPNLRDLQQNISTGNLDFILLKPVDAQFYTSFRRIEIWNSMSIVTAFFAVLYGIFTSSEQPKIIGLIFFLLSSIVALLLLYGMWSLIMSATFWLIDTTNLSTIVTNGIDFAQFPIQVYPKILQFIFTYIFPIAFLSSIPVVILFRPTQQSLLLLLLGSFFAGILVMTSRLVWHMALAKYTSVNS